MTQIAAPDLTVVVPTYNERENVRELVRLLDRALGKIVWSVVFVDDESQDGTADEVRQLSQTDPRVKLIHRIGRRGLAGACIEGILGSEAPVVAVMDGDLQHDERRLADMYQIMQDSQDTDLVIGSRNVTGGTSGDGLSRVRKWGSDRATALVKRLLGLAVSDPMSGFFMLRRRAFNEVVCGLQTHGFKILADMLSAAQGRWKVVEIPYQFRARTAGESKMSINVSLEFLALLISRMTGGVLPVRFVLFLFVGATGLFVQLAVMRLAMLVLGEEFVWAQGIGVLVAMTSNFMLNNMITYRERRLKGSAFLRGLVSFYLVCTVGAVANIAAATALFHFLPLWFVASSIGAIIGALWNFWASLIFTWRAT
jgi:dolichol-phosphate mannosyltransferase